MDGGHAETETDDLRLDLDRNGKGGGIRQQTGAIDAASRAHALGNFQRFATARLGQVEMEPADFRPAAVLIETPLALRAGDALHLAVARRLKATLATIDRRLGEAAGLPGIGLADLI